MCIRVRKGEPDRIVLCGIPFHPENIPIRTVFVQDAAVSYTHLDVYKRQQYGKPARIMFLAPYAPDAPDFSKKPYTGNGGYPQYHYNICLLYTSCTIRTYMKTGWP